MRGWLAGSRSPVSTLGCCLAGLFLRLPFLVCRATYSAPLSCSDTSEMKKHQVVGGSWPDLHFINCLICLQHLALQP